MKDVILFLSTLVTFIKKIKNKKERKTWYFWRITTVVTFEKHICYWCRCNVHKMFRWYSHYPV